MKQFRHIFAILVLAALFGCVRMESIDVPERPVTFSVGSFAPSTKAIAMQDTDDGIYAFRSKGYLYAEGYMDAAQDFFGSAGETISARNASGAIISSGSVAQWAPSHPYYWPKSRNSYIDFVSWYDKNGQPSTQAENAMAWTFDGTARSLSGDDNIMIADKAWHYNDNATDYISISGVSEGVPTLFHHLLAQVRVVVKASKLSDSGITWTVSAGNFTLGNVFTTGSISLSNQEPAVLPSTSPWTTSGWTTTGSRTSISGVTANTSINTAGVEMLPTYSIIPQAVGTAYISFSYTVRTQYDANNYVEETVQTGNIRLSSFTGAGTSWDMNRRITYVVTINPECNEILIDPEASDWTSVDLPPISIE